MKITKEYLKVLIKEEMSKINESGNEVMDFLRYLSKKLPKQEVREIMHDYDIVPGEEPDEFSASVEAIMAGLKSKYKLNPEIISYINAFKTR